MSARKKFLVFGAMVLLLSLPFVWIHLAASPDDAAITPFQRIVAASANYFGPWGVTIVRLADFPNAGLRSFSWGCATGLTVLGGSLLILWWWAEKRPMQILLSVLWGLFLVVWFVVGLSQIADGLL